MSRSAGPFGLMIGLLMMACGGCESTGLINPQQEPLPPGATYLLHLPGISGDTFFDRAWMTSLKEGGVADRVVLFDWTCRDPGIDALQAYARNRRQADQIAHLLSSQAESNPTGHLILTAESGGAALAVWALERLPRNVKVDQVVLVQPAISPGYDLSSALRHVKRNMYYTSSPGDWFVLGFGTRVFGTSDGKRTDAAGLVGFQAPGSADARQYRKLIELKYDPVWMQWGDFGGHTGGLSTGFAYHVLAPLLTAPQLSALPIPWPQQRVLPEHWQHDPVMNRTQVFTDGTGSAWALYYVAWSPTAARWMNVKGTRSRFVNITRIGEQCHESQSTALSSRRGIKTRRC